MHALTHVPNEAVGNTTNSIGRKQATIGLSLEKVEVKEGVSVADAFLSSLLKDGRTGHPVAEKSQPRVQSLHPPAYSRAQQNNIFQNQFPIQHYYRQLLPQPRPRIWRQGFFPDQRFVEHQGHKRRRQEQQQQEEQQYQPQR